MWSGFPQTMPRYLIFWTILLICCGYALLRGRKYERIAATVFMAATVTSVAGHFVTDVRYHALEISDVVIDTVVLIALVAIALASDRFWPLWAAGFQLVGSMAHVLKFIDVAFAPWGYAVAARFWSYPILIVLLIGAWRQHQRSISNQRQLAPD